MPFCLTILSCLILWMSVTFYTLYNKVDKMAATIFSTSDLGLLSREIYKNDLFIDTYTALHDPEFFNHNGFLFTEDVKITLKKMIHSEYQGRHMTLTRYLSYHATYDGLFSGLYQQYLFPMVIEKHNNKLDILHTSVFLRQSKAGISYHDIKDYLRLKDPHEFSHYHWLLIHSIFDSIYKGEKKQYKIEELFFENLAQLYLHGVISDVEVNDLYERYKQDFSSDIATFFRNYRLNENLAFAREKIGIEKYGGAIAYADIAEYYAEFYEISFPLFMAIIQSESNGDPKAISRVGALGLAQIMPATAKDVTKKPHFNSERLFDPEINLEIAARYIKTIEGWIDNIYPAVDHDSKIDLIASAYNAGWSRVKRANGVPDILETRNYVQRVQHYHSLYSNLFEIK